MEYQNIREVIEVDCGEDYQQVNNHIREDWKLLKIRIVGRKEGNEYVEYPVYIMGR